MLGYSPRHAAMVSLDACVIRHEIDREMHNSVADNGGRCLHTHDAWPECFGCNYEQRLFSGRHRKVKKLESAIRQAREALDSSHELKTSRLGSLTIPGGTSHEG